VGKKEKATHFSGSFSGVDFKLLKAFSHFDFMPGGWPTPGNFLSELLPPFAPPFPQGILLCPLQMLP
jgi:hypothetical protein